MLADGGGAVDSGWGVVVLVGAVGVAVEVSTFWGDSVAATGGGGALVLPLALPRTGGGGFPFPGSIFSRLPQDFKVSRF